MFAESAAARNNCGRMQLSFEEKKKDFNSQKKEKWCENRTARVRIETFFIDVVFCIWQTLIYIDLGIDNEENFKWENPKIVVKANKLFNVC